MAGNYRGALQDVRESAALVSAFHVRTIWILGIGAAAAAELGEAGTTRAYIERAEELGGGRDFFYQSRANHWMLGVAAWSLGDPEQAQALVRRAAVELRQIGARPLVALTLRDLADVCWERGDSAEAEAAEQELAKLAADLDLALPRALAVRDSDEGAAELGVLGYHGLRARRLERAGRFEEAAALHGQLGSRWRAERSLGELARSGAGVRSPGARALAGLVLMETAAPQDLEELAAGLTSARYRAGELVHRRGDEARTLEIVESGRIRLGLVTTAGERLLAEVRQGELFGERALLAGEPRATDALAVEDSRLLSLDSRALMRFMEGRPSIAERAVALLRLRVRQEAALLGAPEPADVAGRLLGCGPAPERCRGPFASRLRDPSGLSGRRTGVAAETARSGLLPGRRWGRGARQAGVDRPGRRRPAGGGSAFHLVALPGRPAGSHLSRRPADLRSGHNRPAGFEGIPIERAELARGTA